MEEVLTGLNQEIDRAALSGRAETKTLVGNFMEVYNEEFQEFRLQNKTEKKMKSGKRYYLKTISDFLDIHEEDAEKMNPKSIAQEHEEGVEQ